MQKDLQEGDKRCRWNIAPRVVGRQVTLFIPFFIVFIFILTVISEGKEKAKGKPHSPPARNKQSESADREKNITQQTHSPSPQKPESPPVVIINNQPPTNEKNSPEKEPTYWPPVW